jgi:hypothetical protein
MESPGILPKTAFEGNEIIRGLLDMDGDWLRRLTQMHLLMHELNVQYVLRFQQVVMAASL